MNVLPDKLSRTASAVRYKVNRNHTIEPPQHLQQWSKALTTLVFSIGILVIVGWTFDFDFLKRPFPRLVAMNPLTAVCFILSALSLFILSNRTISIWSQRVGWMLAFIVFAVGIIKVSSLVFDIHLNIDSWLFYDKIEHDIISNVSNRMAPNTAFGFIITSFSLFFLNKQTNKEQVPSQYLALLLGALGMISVLGYLYQVQAFYGFMKYIPMAFHTAIGFLILSAAILLVHADKGIIKEFTGDSYGAIIARKLIPAAFIVPVLMGIVRVYVSRKEIVSNEMGISIMILFIMLIFLLLTWMVAHELNAKDALRKAAETKLKEYQHFFNHSNDFSCIANTQGYFEVLNPKFERVLGYSENELLENQFLHFVHPDDIADTLLEVGKLQEGALTTNFINRYRKKDGSYVWFEWNTTPNPENGKLYAIARDITARKLAEEQLQAVNKELESFSYSVSHDLRAPLRAVNGYAQILKEDYGNVMDAEAGRYTDKIMLSAQRMGKLIDDLLAFSRLGRKEIVKSDIDMHKQVTALCHEFNIAHPEKIIDFKIGVLHAAQADHATIKQVWINLISNAVKYSLFTEKSVIEIGSEVKGNEIIYSIKDNGVGFDMRYADKLFGVFQRLHTDDEFEGTGVGLAIVKRVITKHEGRVWAESKTGSGATFYFTLNKN